MVDLKLVSKIAHMKILYSQEAFLLNFFKNVRIYKHYMCTKFPDFHFLD